MTEPISTKQVLLFVKDNLGDDPDWTTSIDEPNAVTRQHVVRWKIGSAVHDQQAHAWMLFVTFRRADGTEVIGTFKADAVWKSPADLSAADPKHRASWKLVGRTGGATPAAHSSSEGLRLDVGGEGVVAVRMYDIVAEGAVAVYVTAQQWGVQ